LFVAEVLIKLENQYYLAEAANNQTQRSKRGQEEGKRRKNIPGIGAVRKGASGANTPQPNKPRARPRRFQAPQLSIVSLESMEGFEPAGARSGLVWLWCVCAACPLPDRAYSWFGFCAACPLPDRAYSWVVSWTAGPFLTAL